MEDPRGAEGARAKAATDTPADAAIRPSALSTRSLSFLQIIYVYEPPPLLSGAMMMRQTTCRARAATAVTTAAHFFFTAGRVASSVN